MKDVDLSGKRALVTGSRTGIGEATSRMLAQSGAKVVVSGRAPDDCAKVVEAIVNAGGIATEVPIDMADIAAIPDRVKSVINAFGGLDIIVNNAAVIWPQARFGAISTDDFDAACRINLTAPMAVVNAAWGELQANGGRVINVLSGAAVRPKEGWAAYCSTKAGLLMLTQQIDLEGQSVGIRGFGLAPGVVDTNMQVSIRAAKINDVSDIPRENLATPDDPARLISYMASGLADDLAGQMPDIRNDNIRERLRLPPVNT